MIQGVFGGYSSIVKRRKFFRKAAERQTQHLRGPTMTRALNLILCISLIACGGNNDSDSKGIRGVQSGSFEVVSNPHTDRPGFEEFTQYVDMNGLGVYGEEGISEDKMRYVAAVFAELLDNDEDGQWDDPKVFAELLTQEALMPIFASEGSKAEQAFFDNYEGRGVSAVLYNDEVEPSQPGHWGTDATVEETLHTINHVGHVSVYPDIFGLEADSSLLTEAMDVARGGQWKNIPDEYPEEAWYHYGDSTCDYECMAIEYIYWALVSNMEILNDPQTCSGIANEWELCSKELLKEGDVLVYSLITNPNQPLPQLAPDGIYEPF